MFTLSFLQELKVFHGLLNELGKILLIGFRVVIPVNLSTLDINGLYVLHTRNKTEMVALGLT